MAVGLNQPLQHSSVAAAAEPSLVSQSLRVPEGEEALHIGAAQRSGAAFAVISRTERIGLRRAITACQPLDAANG